MFPMRLCIKKDSIKLKIMNMSSFVSRFTDEKELILNLIPKNEANKSSTFTALCQVKLSLTII